MPARSCEFTARVYTSFQADWGFRFTFSTVLSDEERMWASWKALTICSPKSIEPSLNQAATLGGQIRLWRCEPTFAKHRSHRSDK